MISYKTSFRFALSLFTVYASLGCVNRDAHVTKDGATFYVDTLTATGSPNQLNANDAVNQKFMNMTACLKDNAMTSVIMNVNFSIRAGNVDVVKKTDDRGCLIWQELFEYDPTDNEKQIAMTR